MPSTYNGIGTWYHGKTDIHRLKGACEFCNNVGDLTSYDTTLYFVVFFIPVIPISKYRVLQQCPRCEKHRVVKAKQWQEMKNKNTQELFERLDKNPKDRDAIIEGLGSVISYQDPELFERLIPLAHALPEDADVQFQLGATYSYFARRSEATEAYKKSLLAEDRPQTRELMATNLLREGVPDEAEPLVRHILEEKIADKVYLPFLLVETYQSQGKHQQALDMLDDMVAAFPDLENDKDVKKYRKDSTKHLDTGKVLKRVTLVDSNRAGVEKGSNWSKWVPAIIFIGLLGGWLGRSIWLGSNCTVHLLNGGSKPYAVRVNGQDYTIQPGRENAIVVDEGDLVVETLDPKMEIPAVHCKVETPFMTRCFSRPVFLVNPDETAVLKQETSIYAVNPPMPPPPVFVKPQTFHQLPEPDYLFTAFPQSVQVKKNQNITKTRLSVYQWKTVDEQLEYLMEEEKDPARLAILVKRLAQISPFDTQLITWLKEHLKPDEMLKFVQPRLEYSPLLSIGIAPIRTSTLIITSCLR
ncbi:MAG: zinc-ribbon domain-containing protein [Gemmatales bacterium]